MANTVAASARPHAAIATSGIWRLWARTDARTSGFPTQFAPVPRLRSERTRDGAGSARPSIAHLPSRPETESVRKVDFAPEHFAKALRHGGRQSSRKAIRPALVRSHAAAFDSVRRRARSAFSILPVEVTGMSAAMMISVGRLYGANRPAR